jgi:hypothetical protein
MAAKKKTKKKQARSRKPVVRRPKPAKKKLTKKKAIPKKKPLKKASRKAPIQAKSVTKKAKRSTTPRGSRKQRGNDQLVESTIVLRRGMRGDSSLSGDLQGLSNTERADSESVDELLEEGNAFEAGIVSGVEDADNADGREVHTREVPEDDVPDEYLDNE